MLDAFFFTLNTVLCRYLKLFIVVLTANNKMLHNEIQLSALFFKGGGTAQANFCL